MESARTTSKGTMPIWVLFDTEEQVTEAKAWMKGKKNVKLVEPMTKAEAEARRAARYKEIEDAMRKSKSRN